MLVEPGSPYINMPAFQIFVRSLDGTSRCLQFSSNELAGCDLKARVHDLEGISLDDFRLVTGTKEVNSTTALEAGPDGIFPSCTILLRLRGGKGGFGSLLRGAATKAGQKKTSNFDACRDMSGRRLRHVNAEKKLKQWKAEAHERELEKTAQEYLKKLQKTKEEDTGIMEEMKVMKERSERTRESVEMAVKSGLQEAKKQLDDRKRKKLESVHLHVKRSRVWIAEGIDDDSEDENANMDAEEDKEVAVGTLETNVEEASAGPSQPPEQQCLDESPCASHNEHGDQEDRIVDREVGSELGPGTPDRGPMLTEVHRESPGFAMGNASEAVSLQDRVITEADVKDVRPTTPPPEAPADPPLGQKLCKEPIDFQDFESAEELQALGLERLKSELQSRKLKCGGSLAERANRLYLLKSTPLEKIDKKHFIKGR